MPWLYRYIHAGAGKVRSRRGGRAMTSSLALPPPFLRLSAVGQGTRPGVDRPAPHVILPAPSTMLATTFHHIRCRYPPCPSPISLESRSGAGHPSTITSPPPKAARNPPRTVTRFPSTTAVRLNSTPGFSKIQRDLPPEASERKAPLHQDPFWRLRAACKGADL